MGEFMYKSDFYQLSGNFVSDERFRFLEESLESNYIPKTKVQKEFSNIWEELRTSKDYIANNFISEKEQKLLIDKKLESTNCLYL